MVYQNKKDYGRRFEWKTIALRLMSFNAVD